MREAREEIERAAREDPEAIELFMRLTMMAAYGGKTVGDFLSRNRDMPEDLL